jgi:hypothetical protein
MVGKRAAPPISISPGKTLVIVRVFAASEASAEPSAVRRAFCQAPGGKFKAAEFAHSVGAGSGKLTSGMDAALLSRCSKVASNLGDYSVAPARQT